MSTIEGSVASAFGGAGFVCAGASSDAGRALPPEAASPLPRTSASRPGRFQARLVQRARERCRQLLAAVEAQHDVPRAVRFDDLHPCFSWGNGAAGFFFTFGFGRLTVTSKAGAPAGRFTDGSPLTALT